MLSSGLNTIWGRTERDRRGNIYRETGTTGTTGTTFGEKTRRPDSVGLIRREFVGILRLWRPARAMRTAGYSTTASIRRAHWLYARSAEAK
jgi:hypothetical protein